MTKTDNSVEETTPFQDALGKLVKAIEYLFFVVPSLGGIYQAAFLISIGCLRYFSWTQAISDSIVVCCYLLVVCFGYWFRCNILRTYVSKVWYFIVEFTFFSVFQWLIFAYYNLGSEVLLFSVMFVIGVLLGAINFKDIILFLFHDNKKRILRHTLDILIIIIFAASTLIAGAHSSFRYDHFFLEGRQFKVEYRNDTYMFGTGIYDGAPDDEYVTIFGIGGSKEFDILVDRPPIKLSVLQKMSEDINLIFLFSLSFTYLVISSLSSLSFLRGKNKTGDK